MASENPPKQPSPDRDRREKRNRIAEISHRIADIGPQLSAPLRELNNQFIALINEIAINNKATETREQENADSTLRWIKKGTWATGIFSLFSLLTSIAALYVLNKQLDSMHVEQRAWIKIEHTFEPVTENTPLLAIVNIKNMGKTPAKRVQGTFGVQIVNKKDSPKLESLTGITIFNGIINPEGVYPITVPFPRDQTIDWSNLPTLTKTEVRQIKAGETYVVVHGNIVYFDVYGTSHWVNFCTWKSHSPGNYASRKCVEYNDVDEN